MYARNVIGGDLGTSFVHGRPVIRVIADRLPATLLLMSAALLLSSIAGVVLGTLAARHAGRPADVAFRVTALLGQGTPSFWLAQIAILVLAVGTGVFPVQGMTEARRVSSGFPYALDVGRHLSCPRSSWPPTSSRSRRASCAPGSWPRWRRTTCARPGPRASGAAGHPPRAGQRAPTDRHCHRRPDRGALLGGRSRRGCLRLAWCRAAAARFPVVSRLPRAARDLSGGLDRRRPCQFPHRPRLWLARSPHPLRVELARAGAVSRRSARFAAGADGGRTGSSASA